MLMSSLFFLDVFSKTRMEMIFKHDTVDLQAVC